MVKGGYGRKIALIRYFFNEDADSLSDYDLVRRMIEVDVVAEALGWDKK